MLRYRRRHLAEGPSSFAKCMVDATTDSVDAEAFDATELPRHPVDEIDMAIFDICELMKEEQINDEKERNLSA